nr:MAG TPA: hypothetical protein [Caudoviricetes sp.]
MLIIQKLYFSNIHVCDYSLRCSIKFNKELPAV